MNFDRKIVFVILLAFGLFFEGTARQQTIRISGKIVADTDLQPIPFATVRTARAGTGTATNSSGAFMLVLPGNSLADTLQISCIGFKTRLIPIASVTPGMPMTITLVKASIELKEVAVEIRDPMPIIRKAIARIPENYLVQPHVTQGFYRNTTRNGDQFLQLSEAAFEIYNFGYADKKENLFKLVKARDEKNERDFHNIGMGLKPKSIFAADIVKDIHNNDIFSKDGLKKHHFTVEGIVDFKGYQAYKISFDGKAGLKETTYRGKVFIDTQSYAFLYFDYGLTPQGAAYAQFGDFATRLLMKLFKVRIDIKRSATQTGYQQIAGKWVLADVVENNWLHIKWEQSHYDFPANVQWIYRVTGVDTTKTAPFDEKLGKNILIEDHDSNDDNFWKDYNIILPDFNTEEVIAGIRAINQVRNLKKLFEAKLEKLPKDPVVRIDSMLRFYHQNGQFNGTALVKNKGQVILSKSYGFADKEKQLPANPQTTYRIGSLSKSFTSVIINQLMNEGKLDSLAPIRNYLPGYVHGGATIAQLLSHRSGIPNYTEHDDYKLQIFTKSFTLKELVAKFCSDSLEFKSGTGFNYSNSGFVVLALIAEEVTQKPFATLLQERIFTPLQMTDTYAGAFRGNASHQATGYASGIPEMKYDAGNVLGAGGISSSASDLLKFHNALMTEQLLPKAKLNEMFRPRVEFKDYRAWYNYGWMTDKDYFAASRKHTITYHPGTDVGFFTMFVRQEDTDSCIILLNNTGGFPRYDLTDLLLTIMNN